jgi:hypothetical protein
LGFIFGDGKKAAKEQAQATLTAANMQANSDRLVAQAAQQSQETMLAQTKAAEAASELLSTPQDQVDVNLAPDSHVAEIDPTTGKRRTTRSTYTTKTPITSGLNI